MRSRTIPEMCISSVRSITPYKYSDSVWRIREFNYFRTIEWIYLLKYIRAIASLRHLVVSIPNCFECKCRRWLHAGNISNRSHIDVYFRRLGSNALWFPNNFRVFHHPSLAVPMKMWNFSVIQNKKPYHLSVDLRCSLQFSSLVLLIFWSSWNLIWFRHTWLGLASFRAYFVRNYKIILMNPKILTADSSTYRYNSGM